MNTTIQTPTSAAVGTLVIVRSVGQKVLMAITGFVTFGFVAGHMIGNLQVFLGQEQLNTYAETLQHLGGLLWLIRLSLFLFFAIHIWKGIQVTLENWASRPVAYKYRRYVKAALTSRTMIWTGLAVLTFVVYHLLHFTIQATNPEYKSLVDPLGRHDVYTMVILGFQNVAVAIVYIVAIGLLCFHLSHAFSSMFQTIGWADSTTLPRIELLGKIIAVLVFIGYASIPISILAGWVSLPQGGM